MSEYANKFIVIPFNLRTVYQKERIAWSKLWIQLKKSLLDIISIEEIKFASGVSYDEYKENNELGECLIEVINYLQKEKNYKNL